MPCKVLYNKVKNCIIQEGKQGKIQNSQILNNVPNPIDYKLPNKN